MENLGTIRALKTCAAESFGAAALDAKYDEITPKYSAINAWFALALSGRHVDGVAGNVTSVVYKVADQVVCSPAWAVMRGVPASTGQAIDRAVRAGEMVRNDGAGRVAASANRTIRSTLRTAATSWWMQRLGDYEMITARGLIPHPRELNCMVL